MQQAIESLKKQMALFKAGEVHAQVVTEDTTLAVLFLYECPRASHDVLNDLTDWAESTGNHELLDKIYDVLKLK